MLKRLKIKFIAVVMIIVTVLFAAIFGLILHTTSQNIERESIQMMRGLSMSPQMPVPVQIPEGAPDNIRLPFFTVETLDNGEFNTFGTDYFDLTDKDMIKELMDIVSDNKELSGIIPEYDLRFLKTDGDSTKRVIFADVSSERTMIGGLMRNSLIIGFIAYAVIFLLTILLAKWVVKPVEKTWNEQKQFIADASHELKTPLTVIMTNAEMLSDTSYNETTREGFTNNILSMSRRMRGLVESLLELARMDNRTSALDKQTIDLSKLVTDQLLPFEPLFYEKDMIINTAIDKNIITDGDKAKLKQAISILLDNALKYYDPAFPVEMKLSIQSSQCLMSISGHGDTLSKEECTNIFKRFYRVDRARTDGKSYGLGLSIAQSIIEEHKGKIWAESKNGTNTFYVTLNAKISKK